MRKKLLLIIQFLILLNSCSKNIGEYFDNYKSFQSFPVVEKWDFFHLGKEKMIVIPDDMQVINDKYIVVITHIDKEIVQIFDISNGKKLYSFGRKGQGPGEFLAPFGIGNSNDEPDIVWIFDGMSKKLTSFNIESVLNKKKYEYLSIINISEKAGIPGKFCKINNGSFVAIGLFESRLSFYNQTGDTTMTNKYIPGKKYPDITNFLHLQAYQGYINKNDNMEKILICNYASDIIEIYDYSGKTVKTIQGPDFFVPEYSPKDQKFEKSLIFNSSKSGYFSICSSSEYIFGAYSGQKLDIKDYTKNFGLSLFIFDWEGNPIKRIELNNIVTYMDYCSKNNTIYAVCYDGSEFFLGFHKL